MSSLKPGLLRNQLSAVRKKDAKATVIAMRTRNRWCGEPHLKAGEEVFMVAQCDSELAMREAVLAADSGRMPLLIVTDLQDADLGGDLLSRLLGRKLLRMDVWDSLRDLLQAKVIDHRVKKHLWVAEALLDAVPEEGYRAVPGGILTAELLWGEYLTRILGFGSEAPDARHVIFWSMNAKGRDAYRELVSEQQADVRDWVSQSAGELGSFLMGIVSKEKDAALLACGLACEVLFSDRGSDPKLRDAAIRLERRTAHQPVSTRLGSAWGQCALRAAEELSRSGGEAVIKAAVEGMEGVLKELDVADFAGLSSLSPTGFELRIRSFAAALAASIGKAKDYRPDELWSLAGDVAGHHQARFAAERVSRLQMACRLRQWLQCVSSGVSKDGGLEELAGAYYGEGGFIDWARNALYAGDGSEALAKAYAKLLGAVDELRERQNRSFAERLSAWMTSGSSGKSLLGVEEVLDHVVAPLLRDHAVLLLVVDGMSMAVYRQLLEDMGAQGKWFEYRQAGTVWPRPVIAALPTVTEVSRCSLFAGRIIAGDSAAEEQLLREQASISAACGTQYPVLFHKALLPDPNNTDLSEDLRKEISSPRRKLVAVIINAVDDYLARCDQVMFPWTVANIPILDKLLHAARDTGRVVVVTSDHGHVLDRNTRAKPNGDGERYRPDNGQVGQDEMLIAGDRVKKCGGRIIAPWSEHVRYGMKKNGYHGGLTPQEVVVPAVILSAASLRDGYEPCPFSQPEWWCPVAAQQAAPVITPVAGTKPPKGAPVELPLFAARPESATGGKDWIDELLGSGLMAQQRDMAGRTALSDEKIRLFLQALDQQGGSLLLPALAKRIDQPLLRMRGIVTAMQRLLNVEGYPVLAHDPVSDTVLLNRPLLFSQFEMKS